MILSLPQVSRGAFWFFGLVQCLMTLLLRNSALLSHSPSPLPTLWKHENCQQFYGPCVEPARGAFIAWLRNLQISDIDNWLILGDFNFYRSTENRNRPGGNISDTFVFNEAIGESGLIELPLKGRAFTWSNMQ